MDIAIWGTGNVGRYVLKQIQGNRDYQIRYFVDSNSLLYGTKIEGIEVISPEQLQETFAKELDFVLVAFIDSIYLYEKLLAMEIGRFGIVRNVVFEAHLALEADLSQDKNIFWSDAPYCNRPILKKLETNVVDDCNLNCKGCSHFSNLFAHGEKIPFATFCQDLEQVAKHVYVYLFSLLGGEALLDDRIIEYMEFARKTLPDSEIQLITNGLLIPKKEADFFACCRDNNIKVVISGYRPTLLLKDKILDILEKHNIIYSFRINVEEFGKNIDLTGTSNKEEAVKKCREHMCHFLRDGKLYKCPFEALGNTFFEHFHLGCHLDGGTGIYDEDLDWHMLIEELENRPVDACRYCGKEEKITWGIANVPALEDWVVRKEQGN